MIRRISTKWVLAVLAVVVFPFLGFAWYVDSFVSQRFSDDVVRYHLLGHAAELSDRLDRVIAERRDDIAVLTAVQDVSLFVSQRDGDQEIFEPPVVSLFNFSVSEVDAAEYILALDERGNVVATNTQNSSGDDLDEWTKHALRSHDWSADTWFKEAERTGNAAINVFRSSLIHEDEIEKVEDDYHFGFAKEVMGLRSADGSLERVGYIVNLISWSVIQDELSNYGVLRRRNEISDFKSENIYSSTYAWLWAADANTILAHKNRSLYGKTVDQDVGLPQMVAAARESNWGMYPNYTFGGERKKAAFRHGMSIASGGFGWVIGVGVDFPDIYDPIHAITRRIAQASVLVLLLAVVVTIYVARRTTRPVQDLEAFTRRVASGDLDAQIPVQGHDELSDLARSFNRMTHQLKENRAQLVKAEKDAAWREMARQVAHEIKNPLTPIQLSASLLKRAHDDGSPEFPKILERTIDVIHRQVRNMRDIAKDFYRFAGEHRAPVPVSAAKVLDEVLELNHAWAESEGIELLRVQAGSGQADGEGRDDDLMVEADPDELQRALVNLVSNAIEAAQPDESGASGDSSSPSPTRIEGSVERAGDDVLITIRDSGPGIPADVLEHLFEPYFTTRSSGTGLGLAIVRRIIEDRGGSVTLENEKGAQGQTGAVATIRLPHLRV